MQVCKGFLEEWEIDWVEGSEKAKERQDKKQEEIDKNDRFRRIEIKRQDQNRKKVQTRINWSQSAWNIRKERMGGRTQTREFGAAGTEREFVEMEGQRRWEDKKWQRENERTRQENK